MSLLATRCHSPPQAPKEGLLKESSFVLVALDVTSHVSPIPTILGRSNSSSPADSTFSIYTNDYVRYFRIMLSNPVAQISEYVYTRRHMLRGLKKSLRKQKIKKGMCTVQGWHDNVNIVKVIYSYKF